MIALHALSTIAFLAIGAGALAVIRHQLRLYQHKAIAALRGQRLPREVIR